MVAADECTELWRPVTVSNCLIINLCGDDNKKQAKNITLKSLRINHTKFFQLNGVTEGPV